MFAEDRAEFSRVDGALTTSMNVLVSGEDDSEVRRISLTNSGRKPREIEVTSYAELVLTTPSADAAHPAFAKMFVETEYLPELEALVATRRRRSPSEPEIWAAHFAMTEGEIIAEPQYETDRLKFLGRGRTLPDALAIVGKQPLSNTVGTVLDPIFSLRQRVIIAPGTIARIAFWTLLASSRAELIDLLDKHRDRNAYSRAKTLAWTQAQVQLRHLDIDSDEAADFQTSGCAGSLCRRPLPAAIRGYCCRSRTAIGALVDGRLRRPAHCALAHFGHGRPAASPSVAACARVLAHERTERRSGHPQ